MFKMSKKELELSQSAKALMKNPAYKKAFEDVEQYYLNMWKATEPRDKEAREILYLTTQLIQKVKAHLEKRVSEGDAFMKFSDNEQRDLGKNIKQLKRSIL